MTFALVFVSLSGQLSAADPEPQGLTGLETVTIPLEYQEAANGLASIRVSTTMQTVPFKGEAAASGKVYRGIVKLGNDATNAIAFIWQRDAGRLLLDLNRNQDFSDDTNGTYSTRMERSVNYQSFDGIHLPLTTAFGQDRMLVNISLWDYGSRPSFNVTVRSFWQGKVMLHNRDWQVGIIQNDLNQTSGLKNGQFLVRPWENRGQPFSAYGSVPDTVPFNQGIYFGEHAYQLNLPTEIQQGTNQIKLRFVEQFVSLGELKLAGKYIQRMVLTGPYLILLEKPAATTHVPTGHYQLSAVQLESNGTLANCSSTFPEAFKHIEVASQIPVELEIGGPLTNTIDVSRHGQNLRLDYKLIGVGGVDYQLANSDRSHPPEFAVYKGEKKISSGKFEFG